jgi:hypothetical protein
MSYVILNVDFRKMPKNNLEIFLRIIRMALIHLGQYNDTQWNWKPNLNADELRLPYVRGNGYTTNIRFRNQAQVDAFKDLFPTFAEAAVELNNTFAKTIDLHRSFDPGKTRPCQTCKKTRRPKSFRFPGHPALRNICKFCDTN